MDPIALYYPYIHVRDEAWLKYAALYWPKMGRLRPPDYETADSPVAQMLKRELGWIVDIEPGHAAEQAKQPFLDLLDGRARELRDRFGLRRVENWPSMPSSSFHNVFQAGPAERVTIISDEGTIGSSSAAGDHFARSRRRGQLDPRLAYVHISKVHHAVAGRAVEAGLAEWFEGRGGYWLGMHPELVNVYTCALVEQVAEQNRLHPVTDQVLPHTAVSGWTVERLAEVLLGERFGPPPAPAAEDVLSAYVLTAFETVVPKDLADLPVEKVIEIREKFGAELDAFRDYVTGEVERMSGIEDVRDLAVFQEHVRVEVQRGVALRLAELRERLRSIGLESMKATANIKAFSLAPLPSMIALMAGAGAEVTGPMAVASCLVAVASDHRHQRRDAIRESPVGYLLRVDETVNPVSMTERVRSAMRAVWPQ